MLCLLMPKAVFACVGVPCSLTPAVDQGGMPANVPAVVLNTSGSSEVGRSGIALFRADGGAVPASIEIADNVILVRPSAPFADGEHYTVHFSSRCDGAGPEQAASFSITAAQPLPTSIGTLTMKAKGHGTIAIPEGSMCVEQMQGAYAQLELALSPQMLPFLPVTRWSLWVDDTLWAVEQAGAVHANGLLGAIPTYSSQFQVAPRVLEVHAPCPSEKRTGLTLGKHTAELRATIAGFDAPMTSSVGIELGCSGPSDPPTPIEDTPHPTLPQPGCASAPGAMGVLAALVLMLRRRKT